MAHDSNESGRKIKPCERLAHRHQRTKHLSTLERIELRQEHASARYSKNGCAGKMLPGGPNDLDAVAVRHEDICDKKIPVPASYQIDCRCSVRDSQDVAAGVF